MGTNRLDGLTPIERGTLAILLLLERPFPSDELQERLGYTTKPGVKYLLTNIGAVAPIQEHEDLWFIDHPLAQYSVQYNETADEFNFPQRRGHGHTGRTEERAERAGYVIIDRVR